MLDGSEEDPLVHPQHVDRSQDHAHGPAGGIPGSVGELGAEGPRQNQELTDEAVGAGKPDAREGDDQEDGRQRRHALGEPAVLGHLAGVTSLVENPDQGKQGPGRDAVVQHLVHAAADAFHREGAQSQHHEAQMADARVGHELLEIRLRETHQRAVDDPHHRQHRQHGAVVHRRLRKERKGVAQEAEGPHLQEHAGQDDRSSCRCLGVRVGQPGVQREHRDLDCERQREGQKQPALGGYREPGSVGQDGRKVEGSAARSAGSEVQIENRDQHQQRAGHRVDEELHGRVNPPFVAPHADQEVHRQEHRFPKEVEENQVNRGQSSQHGALEQQHRDHELLDPVLDRPERREQGQRGQEGGQNDQDQRHPVDPDVVGEPDGGRPGQLGLELELGSCRVRIEHCPGPKRDREGREHETQGCRPELAMLLARKQPHQDRASGRQEDQKRQDHAWPRRISQSRVAIPSAITMA